MAEEAEPAPVILEEEIIEVPAPLEEVPAVAIPAEEKVVADVEVVVADVEVVAEAAEVAVEAVAAAVEAAAAVVEAAEVVAEDVKELIAEVLAPAEEAPPVEIVIEVPAPVIDVGPVEVPFIEVLSPPVSLVEEVKKLGPQKYADLGKEARDLISKNFHLNLMKLKSTTKAANGFEIIAEGSHNTESGGVGASLETKYKCDVIKGLTFSSTWNTDSVISNAIGLENKVFDGLKLDLDTSYSALSGKKTAKVKVAYHGCEYIHPTLDLDFAEFGKPTIDFTGVLAYQGFHAGYHAGYDSANSKLINNNFSLAYKNSDLVLHAAVDNTAKFLGSMYYKIKEGLCAAAHVEYASGSCPLVTVCGKYDIDSESSMKLKVDNNLCIGSSYTHKLASGLELTLSGLINGKALDQGGHKVGLSLNFEA